MLSKDCFFAANRLVCDYYHKNTSQTSLVTTRAINTPFILVMSRLVDDPLLKLIFHRKTVTQAWDCMHLLYVILIAYSRRFCVNFLGTRCQIWANPIDRIFFSINLVGNDGKKSFGGWDSLKSDISLPKNCAKALQFSIQIQASRISCCWTPYGWA